MTSLRRPIIRPSNAIFNASHVVLAAVASLVRVRRNRRAALDLFDFDADRLADLGLTRADVHAALFDPRSRDPTGMLDAFAAERRRAGRRLG